MTRLRTRRSEAGFSLVELLVVITIMPLLVGAISIALISVLRNQTTVSNSLTGSGDAQLVSANFVADVQGSQWITTSSTATPKCGSGTLLFSVSPDVAAPTSTSNVVSYELVPQASGSNDTLFRYVCSGGVVSSSAAISHNVPNSEQVVINPTTMMPSPASGWVPAQGVTSVNLSISEPPANHVYSLSAVPRLVAAPSSGPNAPVTPLLPFEVLGSGACPATPPDLSIAGSTVIEVGSPPNWNGAMGVGSPCANSISLGVPKGSPTLKATLNTANPNMNSVSVGGGVGASDYPTTETYVPGGITDPFASLAPPSNPSTTGLGAGSCSGSGPYTCSTGIYTTNPSFISDVTAHVTFDPSTAPDPNVIVFNQPVNLVHVQTVNFEGGSSVGQVTYWFRGGLTTSGSSSVTFGPATYIFGDAGVNQSAVNTLSIANGSTINSNNDQGVLWYIENGLAGFSGSAATPIEGSSLYDDIAIWDASSYPITLANGSTVASQFGGVYDSSPSCTSAGSPVACVQFSGANQLDADFLVAYTVSAPTGSATIQITG